MVRLAVLLVSLTTSAASPLADAQQLFNTGDFEAALAHLDAAVRDPHAAELGALHLMRARCLAALRRNADIEPALERALEADPTVTLGDTDASPGFRATLERVRARLAGTASIDTVPPGAAVHIDGAMVGRAPVEQLLPVGRYRVSALDANGAEAAVRDIVVAPRQKLSITLSLTAPGAAVAQTTPAPVAVPAASPENSPSAPLVAEPAPRVSKPWPVEPGIAVRAAVDPTAGVAVEAGAVALGRHWLVELDGIAGSVAGIGARAGGRIGFVHGLLGLQLTADGVGFFSSRFAPGGGATLSFVLHPLDFFDFLIDGSARFVAAAPGFKSAYGLLGVTVRLRWPTGLDRD